MNLFKAGIGFGVGYLAGKYIGAQVGYPINPAALISPGDVIAAGLGVLGAFVAHKM